jgi:hypothetical protein
MAQSGKMSFTIDEVSLKNLHGNAMEICNTIGLHYAKKIAMKSFENVTSPSVVAGNVKALARYGVACGASTVSNLAVLGQTSLEKIGVGLSTDEVSSTTASRENNSAVSNGKTVVSMPNGLIDGVSKGVSGMWLEPVLGYKKSGMLGLMRGAVRGAVGAVTNPIYGALGDISGSMHATATALSSRDMENRAVATGGVSAVGNHVEVNSNPSQRYSASTTGSIIWSNLAHDEKFYPLIIAITEEKLLFVDGYFPDMNHISLEIKHVDISSFKLQPNLSPNNFLNSLITDSNTHNQQYLNSTVALTINENSVIYEKVLKFSSSDIADEFITILTKYVLKI